MEAKYPRGKNSGFTVPWCRFDENNPDFRTIFRNNPLYLLQIWFSAPRRGGCEKEPGCKSRTSRCCEPRDVPNISATARGAGRLRDRGQSEDLPDRSLSESPADWASGFGRMMLWDFMQSAFCRDYCPVFRCKVQARGRAEPGRIPASRAAEILRIDKPERHGNMEHDAVMNFGMRPCLL